jgi:hypothetical protein
MDRSAHSKSPLYIARFFHNQGHKLHGVKILAMEIKYCIEKISPFIQQTTGAVCPNCKEVCCINRHGYYNFEDLIYLHALDLKPPPPAEGNNDNGPCRFLSGNGCSMERSLRPSGCNWYFCDSLLDKMEENPGYREFDDSLQKVADLWLKMLDDFASVSNSRF